MCFWLCGRLFLSTLSLRRATYFSGVMRQNPGISIHALLAESDRRGGVPCYLDNIISIHALLAESDKELLNLFANNLNFYPRSPCGERLTGAGWLQIIYNFYPRSPCGERRRSLKLFRQNYISIHALLAESDVSTTIITICIAQFLSTLSLRRATFFSFWCILCLYISIHALLAESD